MPINHSEAIIKIKDVSFSYGKNLILKDVSLDIHRSDYLGVIGPNGGGKTTLIKLMLGLLPLQKGIIEKPSELKIGYVAQKVTNFDQKFPVRVRDVVAMGRIGMKNDKKAISTALKEVGMENFSNNLIGNLSGGQQQRVFIARALASSAQIIFLDEPTVGVDTSSQKEFYALLRKLNHNLGITLILVSHEIDVVVAEATEVACINQNLIYHGTTSKFVSGNYFEKMYKDQHKFLIHHHA
jgi:zinc transport system ATP-binding protein